MSLYNMLHGFDVSAHFVLLTLKITPEQIGRFRDAYVTYRDDTKTEPVMVVLTRTGGGNRPDYEDANAFLRTLEGYMDDQDDEFDSTFALFRYAVPASMRAEVMAVLGERGAPLTLREKTQQAVGPDQTKRQKEAMEQMAAAIRKEMSK